MDLKALKEKKVELLTEMKDLTENVELFDSIKFDNLKNELQDIENQISEFSNPKKIIENKKEKGDKKMKDFKNKLLSGAELDLSQMKNEGEMTLVDPGEDLVQDTYADKIEKKLREKCVLFDKVRKIVTASPMTIPVQKDVLGKFVKVAELGEYVKDQATFGKVQLGAVKFGTMVQLSEELIQDEAYNLEAELMGQLVDAFAETMIDLMIHGDDEEGIEGLAQGAEKAGAKKVEVVGVDVDALIDVQFALPKAYREGAVFIIGDKQAGELAKIRDEEGRSVLQLDYMGKALGVEGADCTIMGKPAIIVPEMPEDMPIMFVNLEKAMIVGLRKQMAVKRSEEAGFLNDSVMIKANVRLDAKILMEEAIAVLKIRG